MGIDIFRIFTGNETRHNFIPPRDPGALTGSGFIQEHMNIGGLEREQHILNEFLHGNVPDFWRNFVPVTASITGANITYLVSPDYLAIGTDQDYCRMPMNPLTAQAIANKYDCTLPTRKMVNDIWAQSPNKLQPLPWGPPYNADMEKSYRYGVHNARIQSQFGNRNPFALTSGHKKDVVITNKLAPKNPKRRVAIYGWIQLNGQPIQELNSTSHEDTYADYSHGIRLIANDVTVNGVPMRIQEVFTDPKLWPLVSDEGPLSFLKY